jgi:hypothetical protein
MKGGSIARGTVVTVFYNNGANTTTFRILNYIPGDEPLYRVQFLKEDGENVNYYLDVEAEDIEKTVRSINSGEVQGDITRNIQFFQGMGRKNKTRKHKSKRKTRKH